MSDNKAASTVTEASSQVITPGQMELCIDCAALDFEAMFELEFSFERDLDKLIAQLNCAFSPFLVRCLAQESAFDSAFACPEEEVIEIASKRHGATSPREYTLPSVG